MSFESLLNRTATIKQVSYNDANKRVLSVLYSNVPTRREPVQRVVQDKTGHDIVANSLFFFSVASVPTLSADWVVNFNGEDFVIIRAELLSDASEDHHWEVFAK